MKQPNGSSAMPTLPFDEAVQELRETAAGQILTEDDLLRQFASGLIDDRFARVAEIPFAGETYRVRIQFTLFRAQRGVFAALLFRRMLNHNKTGAYLLPEAVRLQIRRAFLGKRETFPIPSNTIGLETWATVIRLEKEEGA